MKTHQPKPKQIFVVCLFFFLFISCEPDPPKPKDWHKDFSTWRSAVSDAPVKSSFKMLGHTQEIVMCVQRKSGKEYFTGLNVNNGKIIWQTLVPNADSVAVADAHVFGSNYVFYANGKIRNINLLNGTNTWEVSNYELFEPDITGLGELFYFSAQSKIEPRLGAIFRGNVVTGQIEELLLAPYTDSLTTNNSPEVLGIVRRIDAVDVNGKPMLIVQSTYRHRYDEIFYGRDLLGLYDLTDRVWQWNVQLFDNGSMEGHLIIAKYHNGLIFIKAASDGVCCLNASNAEILWSNPFDRNIGDIAIIHDMVLIHSPILRNLKIIDGQQNWSAGRINGDKLSKISIFKDVVYLADEYSGAAFRISNGKPGWSVVLEGPTHRKNNRLKGECVVVPLASGNDAMVIYTTELEVYAYKAIL